MSRRVPLGVAALLLAIGALGCERPEPQDPHEFVAAETARIARSQPRVPATANASTPEARVSCRCDADAGLHVVAPEGSIVTVPPDAAGSDAEADIVVATNSDDTGEPGEATRRPLRGVVSLGFVGDGKLTEVPPRYGYDDGGFYEPDPPYTYGYVHFGGGYRPFRPGVGPRGRFHGFHGGHVGSGHVGGGHIGGGHIGGGHIGGGHIGGGHTSGGHGGHGGHGR